MNWRELSLFYCLKICAVKKIPRNSRNIIHEASIPVFNFIEKYYEKYYSFPPKKRLIRKFNLNIKEVWEDGWTIKSLRDELIKENSKFKIQETQVKLQEILISDNDYSVSEMIEPLSELFENLINADYKPPVRLSQMKRVVNKFMEPDNAERVCNFGFPILDKSTGGIGRKDYVLLFGNTNEGKSTFVRAIAVKIALQGKRVLFITLEESGEKSVIKAGSLGSRINSTNVFDQTISRDDDRRIHKFSKKIKASKGDIYFVDNLDSKSISAVHSLITKFNPDIVILDQLSHFLPNNLGYTSGKAIYEHIYYASKSIQDYIHRHSIPWIVLHQSTRHSKSGDKDELGGGYGPMQDASLSIYLKPNEYGEDGVIWKQLRLNKCRDREVDICIDYKWKLKKGIIKEQQRTVETISSPVDIITSRTRYGN